MTISCINNQLNHFIFAAMYKTLRDILFRFDAEKVHSFSMSSFKTACQLPGIREILARQFKPIDLPVGCFGLQFRNPVGLAAGFDKNASYLEVLDILGFGHVEIGTVTPLPQSGNEKPRLFRLPADQAIINRMGFNNDGMEVVTARLRHWRNRSSDSRLIIGGNIGKNKLTPNEDAWKDYVKCFTALQESVDYFVVNVSSPNTPGLRALQEKEALAGIFHELQHRNAGLANPKPLLLKIAPDLTEGQLQDICSLALELKLDGLVATNTTISREGLSPISAQQAVEMGAGGLSGRPLRKRSNEVLHYLHQHTGGQIPLVGSGGVFTSEDANSKLAAGATLVQVWTGFIYEGPAIVKKICEGLKQSSEQ
ncbi:MAG TPA: quinone-dependent dihydroorotate dehydrogenase [Chitinophagaceae bacterium]|nr:quinone-dependent dihydroorotate dehydrogenase [Chitinophagaceae bacterium]